MATISIQADTVRPSVDRRLDDTAFGAGTFSWQDEVHSWKEGPGEVMTVEKYLCGLMHDHDLKFFADDMVGCMFLPCCQAE